MYGRTVDGSVLTLRPSGWTYGRVFVLYDEETGSLWFPAEGGDGGALQAIQGPLFQTRLEARDSADTTWGEWADAHPESPLIY